MSTAALDEARAAFAQGRLDDAERAFATIDRPEPRDLPSLIDLAWRALKSGRRTSASAIARQAMRLDPELPEMLECIGACLCADGAITESAAWLRRTLEQAPGRFIARLLHGVVLEARGDEIGAVREYLDAIARAQKAGRWHNRQSTAPWLAPHVLHAVEYVRKARRTRADRALRPLRDGSADLARLDRALPVWLGEIAQLPPDPRQRPKGTYFPGLPASPYLDRALFPWFEQLESSFETIRAELLATLQGGTGFEPFLEFSSEEQVGRYLGGAGKPRWDAFFFYRHGVRFDGNCERCPRTAAVLDSLPLVRIRGHAPEICFSLLTPGTHILPHHGTTNTRAVVHLPLIVPGDCALRVGGEEHAWVEGRCVAFDDTFEHEAWNRSALPRVVLILDCWNPHLSAPERAGIGAMTERLAELAAEAAPGP